MARQRHLSDGSINATNDINMYNIVGTMTLGRDKKKKSKLKKFFKKLSTKKDGSNTKIEIDGTSDYFSSNDGLSRTSTSSSNNSTSNTKSRRRSDGTLSSHSINDFNVILNNNNNTLNSRRRTFLNLSFIKKATTRKRSHTYTTDYKRQPDIYTSQTVKALCSPHLPRKRLNDFSVLRRGSDPSLYVIEYPVAYSKRGCDRRSDVITYSRLVRTNTQRNSDRRSSHKSSVSSNENDNADYANYPFSKVNVKAPKKPERNHRNGSCSDPFQNTNNDSFGSEKGKNDWNTNNGGNMKFLAGDYRNSTTSSDASSVSDFYSSSRKSDISTENAPIRSSSSLRRTPLRRSIDSFNNLLEVHKQTIDKIAYEISMLHCSCANVQSLDWTDFDRHDELIPLGLSQYMISPVRSHKDKRCYTAWLRIKNQRVTNPKTQGIDYTKSTLHRNCLHVCHLIEQKYQSPNQTGIPTSLQVDHVYISPQVPKMTLAKYTSVTVEKHTKYPEIYEREAAIVLLQIIKALEHYYRHDVIVTTVNTENIVILKTSDSPITLSPRHEPNKCPMIALAALPGFENAHGDSDEDEPIANVCFQLAFVLLELLHSPYHEEVGDAADIAMLLSVLPDLTIKSTYSRHLQYVINFLLTSSSDRFKTFEEMKLILGVILFGPTEISDHDEEEAIVLINKWHNRRCVDMVTHILKEAPLIMLYASGSSTHDIENLKSIDQEIILECEFLSEVLPNNIYRISKKLNR